MCPPAAAPLADIDYNSTNEELIMHLYKLQQGSPLPGNVITAVNPYCHRPENLPDENWYFVRSGESKGVEDGVWKPKEEPYRVFLDNSVSGWRTTLQFFEGQTPHSQNKTDWIMLEFTLIPSELGESIHDPKVLDTCMLCRVFRSGEDLTDPEIDLTNGAECEKARRDTPLGLLDTDSRFEKGSTSNHQEKDESKKGISENPPSSPAAENPREDDYFTRGDYLELWDLEAPGSPSCSSDNSSCVTMSSDECFDSLAFLLGMEPREGPNLESRESNFRLSTSASDRPDRAIAGTAASGSLIIDELRNPPDQVTRQADLPSTSSAAGREKKRECSHENPSPRSRGTTPSSSRQSSDSEGSKKGNGRIKRLKKKYLCFLPFQFLF